MNKLAIDLRHCEADELLVGLNAIVTVDSVRTDKAVRADEIKGEVEEVHVRLDQADDDYFVRQGEVIITLKPDAPKEAVNAYQRLRGI